MNRPIRLICCASLTVTAALLPAATASAAACTWSATSLGLPSAATSGGIQATDHQGGYSGVVRLADNTAHVVSWKNGGIVDYGAIPNNTSSRVWDENRAGTITGTQLTGATSRAYAFRTSGGKVERLPDLPGALSSSAHGINDQGDIVGANQVTRSGKRVSVVVRWPAAQPGQVVELTGVPANASVGGLDEDGTVLLEVPDSAGKLWPHLWRNGATTPLGRIPAAVSMRGLAISNGRVVGSATTQVSSRFLYQGVLWDRDGSPKALPTSEEPSSINRDGLIEGLIDTTSWASGVWRLGTFEAKLGSDLDTSTEIVGDDGTVGGSRFDGGTDRPTVWRCA